MADALSLHDVNRLLAEPSPDVRAELADKVADSLAQPELAQSEIALAQDVLRILARDVEAKVRASVSRGLRNSALLPRDLARRLADDIDVVALPVLAESVVLTDDDLVELVRAGSGRKQETIAARADLTETVSDALIDHAGEPAVAVLMDNHTARISDQGFDNAITRFPGSDRIKNAMVFRPTLPMKVSERLVAMVSHELQRHLVKAHALPSSLASDILHRAREHAIIRLSMGASEDELTGMVRQMHVCGRLTPTIITRALCTGDIAFFEAAMAIKSGVPVANAQTLIHDPGHGGLVALLRKVGMPEHLFDTICFAIDVVDESRFDGDPRDLERFRARVISRLLTHIEKIDPADADYLLDRLGDVLPQTSVS
jgi:uncharacterized protein (DUF2336 family)